MTGAHWRTTALAAARHEVLRRVGGTSKRWAAWRAAVTVIAGEEAHPSISRRQPMLGLGSRRSPRAGRRPGPDARPSLAGRSRRLRGPTIVCAQAGNVNTGAFDPLVSRPTHTTRRLGAHRRRVRPLGGGVAGISAISCAAADADSWTTDAHKWLNVPYDSGLVVVRHPAAHRAAMSQTAAYLIAAHGENATDWTGRRKPHAARESFRYMRCCARSAGQGRRARRAVLWPCGEDGRPPARQPGVTVLNDVVLNQVLVRFVAPTMSGGNITDR